MNGRPPIPSPPAPEISGAGAAEDDTPESGDGRAEASEVVRLEVEECPRAGLDGIGTAGTITVDEGESGQRLRDQPRVNLWFSILIAMLILGGVAMVVLRSGGTAQAGEAEMRSRERLELRDSVAELQRWIDEVGDLTPLVRDAVRSYAAATSPEEVMPMIRPEQRDLGVLRERWEPLDLRQGAVEDARIDLHAGDGLDWISALVETRDFDQRRLVFVVKDRKLELDWRASFEVGDVAFGDLRKLPDGAEVSMLVIAKPVRFSTPVFPEDEWHCFELGGRLGDEFVWGFVRRGSEADGQLAEIMRRDSVLLKSRPAKDLVLRLRRSAGMAPGQFEIVNIERENWIEP